MADILEQDFASAARYLTSRNDLNLSNETQLEFYALYKTVTVGHCKSERPGYFDFKARAKWDAWAAMSGLSKSAAMKQYIKLAGKAGWTRSAVNLHEESGKRDPIPEKHMSMAVSTLENTRDSVEDAEKSVWHWAEEGQTDKVLTLIDSGEASIECKDEQGMTLLHWAADRGYEDLMRGLLSRTANVDVQDSSGQTPLHLAVIVEHEAIIKLLVDAGCRLDVEDSEGESSMACASPKIQELIKSLRKDLITDDTLNLLVV